MNYTDGVLKVPKFLTGVSYEMTLFSPGSSSREKIDIGESLPVDNLCNIKTLNKMKGK